MKDLEPFLNRSAADMNRMIRQGNDFCDELCAIGEYEAAANLREAVGHLTLALAAGRRIETRGGIRPASGGK